MEAKVRDDLPLFLRRHGLEDSISQIDSIVLSYLTGILELISQGEVEDCFDLEDVMEMMNAYLPGFDAISRDSVLEWMFGLAAHLKERNEPAPILGLETECTEEPLAHSYENGGDQCNAAHNEGVVEESTNIPVRFSSFPCYDYENTANNEVPVVLNHAIAKDKDTDSHQWNSSAVPVPHKNDCKNETPHQLGLSPSSPPHGSSTIAASLTRQEKQRRKSGSRRKERYLSCSSQDSQEDASSRHQVEIQIDGDDSRVRSLLEMFPAACTMEASHCLQLSDGNLDLAAQLIMDRQEAGQAITLSKCQQSGKKDRRTKKSSDYKLDDDSIKSTMLEKYSFIDTEEDKKTFKPPPLKNEAKKLVRYRNGQIVSLKGERFSEVKKSSSEDSCKK